jgi:hypothetical protein
MLPYRCIRLSGQGGGRLPFSDGLSQLACKNGSLIRGHIGIILLYFARRQPIDAGINLDFCCGVQPWWLPSPGVVIIRARA